MKSAEEQIGEIRRGVVDLIGADELKERLNRAVRENRQLRVKLGVDPTADDLHIGHAVPLRKLRQFQDLGHKAVLIIGNYTAQVGDPSGRNKTRPQLSEERVEKHAEKFLEQAARILDTDENKLEVRKNGEWFSRMSFLDVIRLTSRATVAQMLERDDFSKRFRENLSISLHEFLYPLMQGWDSVMVKSDVELGGTDQLFNLLVGRTLQAQEGQPPQIAITFPLLVGLDGERKMSKSYGNYIGIDDHPNDMFGKIMSLPDTLMHDYFVNCTSVDANAVGDLLRGHPRVAKETLGREIVKIYHSSDAAETAAENFKRVFTEKRLPDDIAEKTFAVDVASGAFEPPAANLTAAAFSISTSEARRMIQGGGVSWHDGKIQHKIADPTEKIPARDGIIVQAGKRRFVKLRTPG